MKLTDFNTDRTEHTNFMYDTIYFQAPGEKDFDNDDWDDEDDVDFDDEQFQDEAEDVDDLHEIHVSGNVNDDDQYDITNPDPEDDHFPEDELQ